jgi:hypothetical protein
MVCIVPFINSPLQWKNVQSRFSAPLSREEKANNKREAPPLQRGNGRIAPGAAPFESNGRPVSGLTKARALYKNLLALASAYSYRVTLNFDPFYQKTE